MPSKLFNIRWDETDERLLNIFKKECFTVAHIGEYELEEKIKELGVKVQQDMPEGGWKLNGKSISPQNLFSAMSRELIGEYTGGDAARIPGSGWLRTNIDTANSSAYHAAEYKRLRQVTDIYPYYKYMTRADNRVRDEHAALHGKVFFHSDPIWKAIWPPNGWNCRCYVTPMTSEEVQGEGTYVPPVGSAHQQELIKHVPPDFRRNPGIEEHIFTKWAQQKFKDMPKEKIEEIKNKIEEFSTKNTGLSNEEFNKLYESFTNIKIIKKHLKEQKSNKEYNKNIENGEKFGLTVKETSVINAYTSRPFAELNKTLRESENIPNDTKTFERLLNHSLSKLPNFKETTYRGVGKNINPEIDFKMFEDWKKDSIITDKAFFSTSKGKNQYSHRNIEFIVKGKNGKLIEELSNEKGEHEVLFRSGTIFKVADRYYGVNETFKTKKLFIIIEEYEI